MRANQDGWMVAALAAGLLTLALAGCDSPVSPDESYPAGCYLINTTSVCCGSPIQVIPSEDHSGACAYCGPYPLVCARTLTLTPLNEEP